VRVTSTLQKLLHRAGGQPSLFSRMADSRRSCECAYRQRFKTAERASKDGHQKLKVVHAITIETVLFLLLYANYYDAAIALYLKVTLPIICLKIKRSYRS
jgi:hypothetical protein